MSACLTKAKFTASCLYYNPPQWPNTACGGRQGHHFTTMGTKLAHLNIAVFSWFCSSMSLNPAALNHHICLRGLSSTRPAHTNTFTLCKTCSGFCRPAFKPSHIKARWNNSPNIPAGDKPRKSPRTRSVFLLFSSPPPTTTSPHLRPSPVAHV